MKKLASILLISLLFSCTQKQNNKQSTQSFQDENKTENITNKNQNKESVVTMTSWYPVDTTISFPKGETYKKNRWLDSLRKNVGVDFKITMGVPDGPDYTTKVNALLGSSELADFMILPSSTFFKMMEGDYLADLTDDYEKYASPELRRRTQNIADGKFMKGRLMKDGRLYGVSEPGRYEDVLIGYVRQNWLDKLGLAAPTNFEEFEKVAKAFVENDPDGDGAKNSLGYALDNSFYWTWGPFFSKYHISPGTFELEDGKLIWGGRSEKTKQALLYIKDLYSKGIFDKEFYTKSIWTKEPIIKGKAGMFFLGPWAPFMISEPSYNADKAVWTPFVLKDENGKNILNKLSLNFNKNPKAVRKGYKHTDKVIQMMSFWIDEYDKNPDWVNYKVKPTDDYYYEGTRIIRDYGMFEGPDPLIQAESDIQKVLNGQMDEKDMKSKAKVGYENYKKYKAGNKHFIGDYTVYNPKNGSATLFNQEVIKKDGIKYEDYNGPPTQSYIKYNDAIMAKMNELFVSMVINNIGFEQGWNDWITFFEHNHGPEIEKEANDWYSKNN